MFPGRCCSRRMTISAGWRPTRHWCLTGVVGLWGRYRMLRRVLVACRTWSVTGIGGYLALSTVVTTVADSVSVLGVIQSFCLHGVCGHLTNDGCLDLVYERGVNGACVTPVCLLFLYPLFSACVGNFGSPAAPMPPPHVYVAPEAPHGTLGWQNVANTSSYPVPLLVSTVSLPALLMLQHWCGNCLRHSWFRWCAYHLVHPWHHQLC